jgi:branched-chain amino acid transport system substrate-binding protein
MSRPRWLTVVALIGVLAVFGAACSKNKTTNPPAGGSESATGGNAEQACAADEFGCVEVAAGQPIQLGTLLAISGDTASLGLDSQRGVKLAIDNLDGTLDGKDGQLLGHDVKLANEDDGCTAEGGQSGAAKLVGIPNLLAVIGTSCSSAALGVADKIFSDKGILLISPSNTNPNLTAEGSHQAFYLRTAHNDKIQGSVQADFANKVLKAKTAATIHDESPYADALAEVFRAAFELGGGQIVGNEAIQSTDTDFKPLLTNIGQNAPDYLYYPDFNPACALIAKQAAGISSLSNSSLGGSDGCGAPDYAKIAGPAANGTFISGPDLSAIVGQNAFYKDTFLPAYNKEFATAPTASFHAHAFDAANILFKAVEASAIKNDDGSLSIPRSALKDAIFATKDYKGLTGTITCVPLGDCATEVAIAVYKVPNDPFTGGATNAKPVFSETKTLAEVEAALNG